MSETYTATGRRKTAVARVWITAGTGEISVNGDAFEDVFIRIRIAAIVSMRGFNYQGAVADLLRLLHDSSP